MLWDEAYFLWILPTPETLLDEGDLFGDVNINANVHAPAPAADTTPDPVIDAEAALSQVLGELQEVGVLQKNNVVDIEDLVHIPEEQVIKDATDEEIFETVQKTRARQQD
ncbi:hypothetical protein FB451DRAFT_1399465 [Mycena latifolia]|nr:hypothetical protein FB451DRAFT_1399465 [Mycena latifolia]